MDEGIIKFYEASGIVFNRVGKLFSYRERLKVRYTNITCVDNARDSKYIKKMLKFYIDRFGKDLENEKLVQECIEFSLSYQDFILSHADFKTMYYFYFLEAVYHGCRQTKFYNLRR